GKRVQQRQRFAGQSAFGEIEQQVVLPGRKRLETIAIGSKRRAQVEITLLFPVSLERGKSCVEILGAHINLRKPAEGAATHMPRERQGSSDICQNRRPRHGSGANRTYQ